MSFRQMVRCLLLIAVFWLIMCLTLAANPEGQSMGNQEYKQDRNRIETLGEARDLDGLETFAGQIENRWAQKEGRHYFDLMLTLCDQLSTYDYADKRQFALEEQYALSVLQRSETIPLETETGFLLHILDDTPFLAGNVADEEWAVRRFMKTKLWLRAWNRLENEIDSDFDFDDLPMLNIAPPPGVDLPPGVAPEHIEDAELRAEYEAAIEANRQKTERHNTQHRLRLIAERFLPRAEQYIIDAYTKPPLKQQELKELLEHFISEESSREKIMKAVGQGQGK